MRIMRVPAPALLVLALLAPARDAAAQRSGLLLGVGDGADYRTLWIAPVEGRLRLAVERPALVVPAADGFWRVAVERRCSVSWRNVYGGEDSMAFLDYEEPLVRRRADAAAPDSAAAGCAAAQDAVTAATVTDSASAADAEDDVCYFEHTRITHVSPALVSYARESGTTEFCNPARYTSEISRHVWRFDGAWSWDDSAVTLMDKLPPARRRWLAERFEAEKGDCALQDSPDEAWGIERGVGHWRAAFATSGAVACRGDSGGAVTATVVLPRGLARADDAGRWLPALRARHGRVSDVFTSPAGDLVVARVGAELVAYVPRGGALGEPALRVALHADVPVVMAEWATGTHVDRWTRELGAPGAPGAPGASAAR